MFYHANDPNDPNRDALEQALLEALQDEYKACATYAQIIRKFGPIRPFVNIIEAEKRHIQALLPLFRKYGIAIPANDWDSRVAAPDSILEACQQGVQAEIENGEMYDRLLQITRGYDDVQNVFFNLQRASQQNHLRAFQRGVERSRFRRPLTSSQSSYDPVPNPESLATMPGHGRARGRHRHNRQLAGQQQCWGHGRGRGCIPGGNATPYTFF
jgi:hypothetical protein